MSPIVTAACLLHSQFRLKRCAPLHVAGFVFLLVLAATAFTAVIPQSCPAQDAQSTFKIDVIDDLAYYAGDDADPDKHKLDLYLPAGLEDAPVILWIHGGAWATGSRKQESLIAKQFAARGIAVAVMSYRLSPGNWMSPDLPETGVVHPAHINDVARAFAWLHAQADEYPWSAQKLFVSGYSAGGHLSALLGSDPQYLAALGLTIENIRGAIPIAGAYDIVKYYEALLEAMGQKNTEAHIFGVFGPEEGLPAASPTSYVAQSNAPMLVISEKQTFSYTAVYEELVINAEIDHIQFVHYMDKTHKTLYENMQTDDSRANRRIVEFVQSRCADLP